jgi:ATP-dependent RNA helicase DeaD
MTFPTIHPALTRALAERGYDTATPVQLAVLEGSASGRDLLVSAQTGSGKTVAFGLALGATLLADDEQLPEAAAPLALIIAPTRELAMQVCRELSWLYEAAGARVITCVGGMDARAEARQLRAGGHIVVGTPGRLRDHLERSRLDLSSLRAVVLDEADEMLDLGFREDLEFILDATPAERRTLLFSATVPRGIEALARRFQRDALRIETGRRDQQHADIQYLAHRVVPQDVENTVVNVLRFHEARAALVFCATREAVNRLSARLVERGFAAVALSGELTQHERTQSLQALRDGRARVLVATDVAARGLDLPDLALVIHAELPNDGETLLHRSGRTGRAGKQGLCVLIVPANRWRKADAVITAARLNVTWRPAPTPEEIQARDQERFFADASFTAPANEEEAQFVRALHAVRKPDEIALALIRLHSASLPAPETLAIDTGPPPRRDWKSQANGDRTERPRKPWQRDDDRHANGAPPRGRTDARAEPRWRDANTGPHTNRPASDAGGYERPARPGRNDTRPMTWFRINIGRKANADPRWLLPLICRVGSITKSEVGAIRVDEIETRFQILAQAADQFEVQARAAKEKEGHIVRVDAGSVEVAEPVPRTSERSSPPPDRPRTEKRSYAKPAPDKDQKSSRAPWRDRAPSGAPKTNWAPKKWQGAKPGGHGQQSAAKPAEGAATGAKPKYPKKKKPYRPAPAGSR